MRRALGLRRVGHTGTLDPFATGVLPLCIGRATRLASFLSGGSKAYEARLRLGFATSTDDLTGTPLGTPQPVTVTPEGLEAIRRRFIGELEQLPPAYSAKRVGGRRLYELARRGAAVERKPSRVTVFSLALRRLTEDTLEASVRCSAGTYVRALARDIGEALGTGGHLTALRRIESGGFGLNLAVTWDELLREPPWSKIVRLKDLLLEVPSVRVGSRGIEAIRHGRDIDRTALIGGSEWCAGEHVRVLGEDGALLALGVSRGNHLHPRLVLID